MKIALALVIFAILGITALIVETNVFNRSTILAEPSNIEFGTIAEGTIIKRTVLLRNLSTSVKRIDRTFSSCGCTTAQTVKSILPGRSAPLDITFNSAGKRGEIDKIVGVLFEGQSDPILVSIKGKSIVELVTQPDRIDFGRLAVGVNRKESISVRRADNKQLRIIALQPDKPILGRLVKSDGHTIQYNLSCKLSRVMTNPPQAVTFQTDDPLEPILIIPIYLQQIGVYDIEPPELDFGTGVVGQILTKTITITGRDADKIKIASLPPGISYKVVTMSSHDQKFTFISCPKGQPGDILFGKVVFSTAVSAQPRIEIPVTSATSP